MFLIKPEISELIQKTNSNEDLIQHINSLKGFCDISNTELKNSYISDRLLAQATIYLIAPIQAKLGQKYANIHNAFSSTQKYTDYITVPLNQIVNYELWQDIDNYASSKCKEHIPRRTYQFVIDMESLMELLMIPDLDIIYKKAMPDTGNEDIFIIPDGIDILPAHYRTDNATQKIIYNDQKTNFPYNYYSLEWLRILLSIEKLHANSRSCEFINMEWVNSFYPTIIAYKVIATGAEQVWADIINGKYSGSFPKINQIQKLLSEYIMK